MFKSFLILVLFICLAANFYSQGFNLPSKGMQVFNFNDAQGRNQATTQTIESPSISLRML